MKRKTRVSEALAVALSILLSWPALGGGNRSQTEAYLERLHRAGKERVIVRFRETATPDASLVSKHGGKLIRKSRTVKALVCEMTKERCQPIARFILCGGGRAKASRKAGAEWIELAPDTSEGRLLKLGRASSRA
jgi:hypothetical protein